MKKPRRLPMGTFFCALALCLCVLGLGTLFLLIECNMQQTMTGQVTPPATFTLEDGCPVLTARDGHPLSILPPTVKQCLKAFCGAPLHGVSLLIRQEQVAVSALLKYFA